MAWTLLFLLALSCAAQDEKKPELFTVTVREVPGDPKPLFRCEGTTTLPDRARLQITLWYDTYHPGMHVEDAPVMVKDGKYRHDFTCFATKYTAFPDRNMAGKYLFRVHFVRGLQRYREHKRIPEFEKRKELTIGTPAEIRRDQRDVKNRLIDQARAVAKMSEEIFKAAQTHPEEFGTPKWDKRVKEWGRRGLEIEKNARSVPEYRALKIVSLAGDLEGLRSFIRQLAYFAEQKNRGALRQGRAAIAKSVQDFKRRLAFEQLTREQTLELATTAQEILKSSTELDGEALNAARRRFIEAVMALGSAAPVLPQANRITKLVQSTRPYFAALEKNDEESATELRAGLQGELKGLIEVLKKVEPAQKEE